MLNIAYSGFVPSIIHPVSQSKLMYERPILDRLINKSATKRDLTGSEEDMVIKNSTMLFSILFQASMQIFIQNPHGVFIPYDFDIGLQLLKDFVSDVFNQSKSLITPEKIGNIEIESFHGRPFVSNYRDFLIMAIARQCQQGEGQPEWSGNGRPWGMTQTPSVNSYTSAFVAYSPR